MIFIKKKHLLLTYLIFLLILISISRGISNNAVAKEKKEKSFYNTLKTIPYYNKYNKERYLNYKKNNPSLTTEELIINVNIGLDYPYYTNTKKITNLSPEYLLVNKYNYLDENYIPADLTEINSKYSSKKLFLAKSAAQAFEELAKDALKENLNIIAMSTYRSYSYQSQLYKKYVEEDGTIKADTYSARPGFSEHQSGLAVDVCNKELPYTEFEKTKEFAWLENNAHKYGFILRYPKEKTKYTTYQYEPWHYRYVGKETAKIIYKENLSLEEYFAKQKSRP